METTAVVTKKWVSENFAFGAIEFNPYYKAFLVTFETERYHNGGMTGGSLAQQHERAGETLRACSSFDIIQFNTGEEAVSLCNECGVTPYFGHVVYHVDGRYWIEQ